MKKEKYFFGEELSQVYPTQLDDYPIESIVSVQAKEEVLKAFEFIGRNDYLDYMNAYCGKQGKVISLHPTNGIRVQFEDNNAFWYEPGCLKVVQKGSGPVKLTRLPPTSLVRIKDPESEDYDLIGQIKLQVDPQSSKISVLIGGQLLKDYESQYLEIVNYFFQNEVSKED